MDELRVPTIRQAARLLYRDRRQVDGALFLPAAAQRHDGPSRAAEVLNGREPFFPLLPDGGGAPALVNKDALLLVSLRRGPTGQADGGSVPRRRVRVEMDGGVEVEGDVELDLPETGRRVLDLLNRDESFLRVEGDQWEHLVRKAHVLRVEEMEVGP